MKVYVPTEDRWIIARLFDDHAETLWCYECVQGGYIVQDYEEEKIGQGDYILNAPKE